MDIETVEGYKYDESIYATMAEAKLAKATAEFKRWYEQGVLADNRLKGIDAIEIIQWLENNQSMAKDFLEAISE